MKEWTTKDSCSIRWYDEVSSTNDVAREWAKSVLHERLVVVADNQTNGRGRRGASWVTPAGEALAFSLVLRPTMVRSLWPRLALVSGLAVAKVLESRGLYAEVKWPNDVHIDGKKICGILLESIDNFVVIGVGVNINVSSFPAELENIATSMKCETGFDYNREELLENFISSIMLHAQMVEHQFDLLLDSIRERCALTGKRVTLTTSGELLEGVIAGLANNGDILLDCGDRVLSLCQADDIRASH